MDPKSRARLWAGPACGVVWCSPLLVAKPWLSTTPHMPDATTTNKLQTRPTLQPRSRIQNPYANNRTVTSHMPSPLSTPASNQIIHSHRQRNSTRYIPEAMRIRGRRVMEEGKRRPWQCYRTIVVSSNVPTHTLCQQSGLLHCCCKEFPVLHQTLRSNDSSNDSSSSSHSSSHSNTTTNRSRSSRSRSSRNRSSPTAQGVWATTACADSTRGICGNFDPIGKG